MESELVDEDRDPDGNSKLSPGNEPGSRWRENGTLDPGTGAGLPVAGPADDPPIRPHLDLEDLGGLGSSIGCKGRSAIRTAFPVGREVVDQGDGGKSLVDRPPGTSPSGLLPFRPGRSRLFRGEARANGSGFSLLGLPSVELLLQGPDLGLERRDFFQKRLVVLPGLFLGPLPPPGRRPGLRRMGCVTSAGNIGVLGAGQAGAGRNIRTIRNGLRCLKVGKGQKCERSHASCIARSGLRVQPLGNHQGAVKRIPRV